MNWFVLVLCEEITGGAGLAFLPVSQFSTLAVLLLFSAQSSAARHKTETRHVTSPHLSFPKGASTTTESMVTSSPEVHSALDIARELEVRLYTG